MYIDEPKHLIIVIIIVIMPLIIQFGEIVVTIVQNKI